MRLRQREFCGQYPSLEIDGLAIVEPDRQPPAKATTVVIDDEVEEEDQASTTREIPAPRKRVHAPVSNATELLTTHTVKKRRTNVAAECHRSSCCSEPVAIKQERDGGWPAAFQALRELPFDEVEYERLRSLFFTEYEVCAGSRESRTRSGSLRVTPRITRTTVRIAEWPPRLQQTVEELHGAGHFHLALKHLRCLEKHMQMVGEPTPRILRDNTHAAGDGDVEEVIDLEAESNNEPAWVDVEELEDMVLTTSPVQPVKTEPPIVPPNEFHSISTEPPAEMAVPMADRSDIPLIYSQGSDSRESTPAALVADPHSYDKVLPASWGVLQKIGCTRGGPNDEYVFPPGVTATNGELFRKSKHGYGTGAPVFFRSLRAATKFLAQNGRHSFASTQQVMDGQKERVEQDAEGSATAAPPPLPPLAQRGCRFR